MHRNEKRSSLKGITLGLLDCLHFSPSGIFFLAPMFSERQGKVFSVLLKEKSRPYVHIKARAWPGTWASVLSPMLPAPEGLGLPTPPRTDLLWAAGAVLAAAVPEEGSGPEQQYEGLHPVPARKSEATSCVPHPPPRSASCPGRGASALQD